MRPMVFYVFALYAYTQVLLGIENHPLIEDIDVVIQQRFERHAA